MTLPIMLLALGLAFVIAEVLFPSFGVLSVLATAAIIGAIVSAFAIDSSTGWTFLGATALLLPATIMLGVKLFPHSPMGKHLVVSGLSFESRAATDEDDLEIVGKEGVLEADCHPTGIARIAGRRVDVVSRGEPLDAGTAVRVLEVTGNRVVAATAAAGETDQGQG